MNRFSIAMAASKAAGVLALATLGAATITPAVQAATPYSYTETFEDGALNTPGVTASGGSILGPGPLTDSVEGANPPNGSNGFSYYSAGSRNLRFTFNKAILGMLPTKAGITWTDVGFVDGDVPPVFTGKGNVVFQAFDESNTPLGSITKFLGDGQASGQTAEDFIFSFMFAGGIGAIEIGMPNSGDWEVDDLQYSADVPTPALLPGLIGLGIGVLRKRKGEQAEQSS